jgi:RNA-binding protein 39
MKDPETDRSKGYGFIVYHEAEDAKKAMEHLNGFELAGRPMKVLTIFLYSAGLSVVDP